MTERVIPEVARQELERSGSPFALLGFLVIEHSSLSEPVRLVSDVFDYVLDGETYSGMPFEYKVVTDGEAAPTSMLRVQNVDRRIGVVLRDTIVRPKVGLKIISSADFDLTQDPRVVISSASVIYEFAHFELSDVTVNVIEVSGTLKLFDPSTEPWPSKTCTQERAPALYR